MLKTGIAIMSKHHPKITYNIINKNNTSVRTYIIILSVFWYKHLYGVLFHCLFPLVGVADISINKTLLGVKKE